METMQQILIAKQRIILFFLKYHPLPFYHSVADSQTRNKKEGTFKMKVLFVGIKFCAMFLFGNRGNNGSYIEKSNKSRRFDILEIKKNVEWNKWYMHKRV